MGARCTICNTHEHAVRLHGRPDIFRCGYCSHQFSVTPPDAGIYSDEYYAKRHQNWFKNPNYGLFDFIDKTIRILLSTKSAKLLDVGCGKGDFLKYMEKHRPHTGLYGVDIASHNASGRFKFIKGDILRVGIDEKFHVITCLASIEHVDDPRLFTARVRDLLLPGGVVFITTVNSGGIFYRIARLLDMAGMRFAFDRLYSRHHLQHYTVNSLRNLMENNGFRILRHMTHNFPMNAIDIPDAGIFIKAVYMTGTALIFAFSSLLGGGMLQTAVCRKETGTL